MKKQFLLLAIIIAVAAILRFYQIGSNPPSLTWDETAWGYNAYTLGIDGKDEFGRFLPYDFLESFGDFKPPLYAYLAIIPVKLFGLTEFATRFPSAFFGTLTVLMTFLLVKELFIRKVKEEDDIKSWNILLPLIAASLLALSPWHIMLSRAAFEANVASFFLVTGVWAFLVGVQHKKWYLLITAVAFALSFYTFNTARIVAPLLALLLVVGFYKRLWVLKKPALVAFLIGLFMVLPIVPFLLSPQASLRFREVNIFSDSKIVEQSNAAIANDNNAPWSKIIHNRRVGYAREYVKHYFDNLSLNFLFIKGDQNVKFSIQDVGQMYLWELPFFIMGILFLIRRREKNWWIIPLWLLAGIIPAATARETPHALRIESTLPTFQIITAYGITGFVIWFSAQKLAFKKLKQTVLVVVCAGLFINVLYFLHSYYVHYPIEHSREWQYGYKESIAYAESVEKEYQKINVSNELGRAYVYYLFYLKVDPQIFRESMIVTRDTFGFVSVEGFGKYKFGRSAIISKPENREKVLYITTQQEAPSNAKMLKEFKLLNGETSLAAYTYLK